MDLNLFFFFKTMCQMETSPYRQSGWVKSVLHKLKDSFKFHRTEYGFHFAGPPQIADVNLKLKIGTIMSKIHVTAGWKFLILYLQEANAFTIIKILVQLHQTHQIHLWCYYLQWNLSVCLRYIFCFFVLFFTDVSVRRAVFGLKFCIWTPDFKFHLFLW